MKKSDNKAPTNGKGRRLRSLEWFNNPHNPGMTALYLERYLNYGLTREELQSGKPIIGIAQTGNDLSPCNRHHLELAHRVREGIREAGGIAMEFPTHPIQETGKRPTAALDRNLAYLGLVEILFGYPLDGVVLTTGCDKTTPACMMAAATVNIPAIVLSGGPMLNGWFNGERTGSGTVVWKSRERLAAGEIDYDEFIEIVASSAPSVGHCNTMGTASTMNSLAEALGMSLPGCAAIPAPYRERGQIAYETGKRIVEMVWEDLKPSDILTRKAFENCIVGEFGDRRLDQRADPHQRAGAAYRRRALDRRLAEARPRHPAAGEHAAGRLLSRRGISSRRRRARGGARIDGAQAHPRGRPDGQRPHHGRELPRGAQARRRRDLELRQAAGEGRRLPGAARQPVRFRDHEDQRDLEGIPRPLSDQSRRTRTRSRAAPSCSRGRRIITTGSTIPRSTSTSTACCSCAAPGRSAIPAAPRS